MRKGLTILLLGDLLVVLLHFFSGKELGFFNLDREQNLAAVYSGFKLLAAGFAAMLLAFLIKIKKDGPQDVWEKARDSIWLVLAGLFIYLALDEMMYLHERIGFVINHWTGLAGSRGESFWWYAYFSPFILLGAALLIYMWRIIKTSDHILGRWFMAGALFFILAIATEGLSAIWYARKWYEAYQNLFVAEEAFELIGESIFATTLWKLAKKYFTSNFTINNRHINNQQYK